MTAPIDPGSVAIEAHVASRRVRAVDVASTRPSHVARLFVGRTADEVPALAERLFALCGRSHAIAAARATAAAFGWPINNARRNADAVGLAAERIAETLRGTLTGDLAGDAALADPKVAMLLREAQSAARTLMTHGVSAGKDAAHAPALLDRLAEALRALGVAVSPRGLDASPRTVIGRLMQQAEAETGFRPRTPDMLTEADDVDVVAAVRAQGEGFSASPFLPGRTPETGAYARCWQSTANAASVLAARLYARVIDMVECLDWLDAGVAGGVPLEADPVRTGATGSREGFAALESPRGRLYHWLRAAPDRRVLAYAIVAPTEWNFHPQGPLVEALLGAEIGGGEEARRRAARLVAAFDPCVSFEVRVTEATDA